MTNPPDNPAGPPNSPNGPWGPPPGGQQPPQGPPPQGPPPQGPPPQGPPPQGPPPQGPPPQGPPPQGPPPGWQPPHNQPVWQGHQAPHQSGYAWQQQPPPPKKSRTGLVIGIVVVALLLIGGAVAAIVAASSGDSGPDVLEVGDLKEGTCLTSDDLAQGSNEVDDMTEADCDDEHDAKVFAVLEVQEGESFTDAGGRCAEQLGDDFATLRDEGIEVRPLAEASEPQEGDDVVCFLRHEDGKPLDQDVV